MSGTIRTYQKCPRCGASFPSSKGGFPIICNPCQTQPTKYFINIWWQGKAEFLYHDRDGRTMHDWGHAVAILGEIRAKMASHKKGKGFFDPSAYKKQSSTSFQAFWERFVDGYSGSTRDKIKAIGCHHLTYFSDMQMRDIVPWHIDEWWRELRKKGLSNTYCNDIQTWLRSFFNNALRLDVIEKMPIFPDFLDIKSPEVDEWLTESEQLAVLGAIPEYDRPIFDFMFLTGVRVGEACGLQRSDIKNGIVTIRHTVKRDGSIGIVKNKKPRRIPLRAVEQCFSTVVVNLSGYVFINKWSRRYSDDYLRETFYKACDSAGVKRIKLKNATRHSFGMGLLRKGYDIWQVSKIMGHSDIKITEHYAKMVDSDIGGAYGRHSKTIVSAKSGANK
jgi:integrase